jgi:hypothetical protein
MVDELVLNVIKPADVPEDRYLPEYLGLEERGDGIVHPRTVARQLIDMFHRIWAGEGEGRHYQILLERIKRVRVCLEGETWRVRELRLELERGQAERRRIAARLGYYRV